MSKHPRYRYIAEMDYTIAGIPCMIGVISFHKERGSYSGRASDPDEYYGYVDADWIVLDRKGYVADWLANKLTQADEEKILETIIEEMSE